MPLILALIAKWPDEMYTHLTQYHHPRLLAERIDAARLDSIYRIVRIRPGLCNTYEIALDRRQGMHNLSMLLLGLVGAIIAILLSTQLEWN
jgi:hypothetical protein